MPLARATLTCTALLTSISISPLPAMAATPAQDRVWSRFAIACEVIRVSQTPMGGENAAHLLTPRIKAGGPYFMNALIRYTAPGASKTPVAITLRRGIEDDRGQVINVVGGAFGPREVQTRLAMETIADNYLMQFSVPATSKTITLKVSCARQDDPRQVRTFKRVFRVVP